MNVSAARSGTAAKPRQVVTVALVSIIVIELAIAAMTTGVTPLGVLFSMILAWFFVLSIFSRFVGIPGVVTVVVVVALVRWARRGPRADSLTGDALAALPPPAERIER